MKWAMAVTGYVSAQDYQALSSKQSEGAVDVRPELDVTDAFARVQLGDVAEVRSGARAKGDVLVQLILKPRANVETIVRASSTVAGVRRFHDPVLDRVRALAAPKQIAI